MPLLATGMQSKESTDKKVSKLHLICEAPWDPEQWQGNRDFAMWLLEAVRRKMLALNMSAAMTVATCKHLVAKADRLDETTKG